MKSHASAVHSCSCPASRAFADIDVTEVHQALEPCTQGYLWCDEPFELRCHADEPCPFVTRTQTPASRILWAQFRVGGSSEDERFAAGLLSLITTTFSVRSPKHVNRLGPNSALL